MSFIEEFKSFAMRGNVVDLAVWVVIGWAFGKIVTSLVADIIMPIIAVFTGSINFSDYKIIVRKAVEEIPGIQKSIPAVSLNWWSFLQATVDFLIIAFFIFLVVKAMAKLHKTNEAVPAPVEDTKSELLLAEIRDLLKK